MTCLDYLSIWYHDPNILSEDWTELNVEKITYIYICAALYMLITIYI